MNRLLCTFALILTLGCTKAVFRPYVGSQQSWPTAEGSIVNTKYKLPIFTNLPPSPYEVLGEIRIESPLYAMPEEHHMPIVCKKAEELGANAVIFVQGRVYFATNYGPRPGDVAPAAGTPTLTQVNTFNPESFEQGVTILAVKWIGEPPPGLATVQTATPVKPAEAVPAPVEPATEAKPEETPAAPETPAPSAEATKAEEPTKEEAAPVSPPTEPLPVPSEPPAEAPAPAEPPSE